MRQWLSGPTIAGTKAIEGDADLLQPLIAENRGQYVARQRV
jgi:hypothetical protein